MIIAIHSITDITTRHGGHDIFRLDGYYSDEFGELQKCKTFVDPKMDNFKDWVDILAVIAENRGNIVQLDGCRMKNRAQGLVSADSKPRVESIYVKPTKKKAVRPVNTFTSLFGKL